MHLRKTLQIFDNPPHETSPPTVPSADGTATSEMPSPFHSSMALTILVLLTGLFFMGFFSVFIRRVYHDPPADVPHRLRSSLTSSQKGLDPAVIVSLPVWNYYGDAKYKQEDCVICLGDFEENDVVKVIPRCRHVFHVECIDTWLLARASCPVCRGTQLFDSGGNVERTEQRVDENVEGRSTVENGETCNDMRALRLRRSSSCSSMSSSCLGDRDVALRRTSSFDYILVPVVHPCV